MRPGFLVAILVIVLSEFYFIQAVRTFSQDFASQRRAISLYIVYGLLFLDISMVVASMVYPPPHWNMVLRFAAAILFILILCKVFCFIFLFLEDVTRLFRWIGSKLGNLGKDPELAENNSISRLKFISQVALTFTVIPAIGFLYGMVRGAYKYRVHKVKVPAPNLPSSFDGFRIVQISDIHTGSFLDNTALGRAFDIVMKQSADLILFTGDLVNNMSIETEGFTEIYSKLKAPHGVFSVLGNHDYGDYVQWESADAKKQNLENLKKIQANAGWRLLMNEHVPIEKNGEAIALLGIENWGGSLHFPRYGKMSEAHKGTEKYPFKILMSHDPSHWEKEVQPKYPDVDLTLSGHTHGMQLGIEIPG